MNKIHLVAAGLALVVVSTPALASLQNPGYETYLKAARDQHIVVNDQEVLQEYNDRKVIEAQKTIEFSARQVLVASRQEALNVLALTKSVPLFELARKYSIYPTAKQDGGGLGFFKPEQMVPEFSNVVAALKDKEIASAPLQTKDGWHVIQREGTRSSAVIPPLESVKEPIRNLLMVRKFIRQTASMHKLDPSDSEVRKEYDTRAVGVPLYKVPPYQAIREQIREILT